MTPRERLVLLGHPVSQSLSPLMQNAAFDAAGMTVRYEAIDVSTEDLGDVLAKLKSQRAAGNVTVPHKRKALMFMQKLTSAAKRADAVNTFWVDSDGDFAGDNTDVAGFNLFAEEVVGEPTPGMRVAVLGAGGAAGAVITAIESWPDATISVHARDLSRAVAMRMRHSVVVRACSMRDPCLADASIIVNATPAGMDGHSLPIDISQLSPGSIVLDLVYLPGETALVRDARAAGHTAADGLRMLLHQGAASFKRWFDVAPDKEVMWSALARAAGRS
jgi:shikimate dehydrogenase